jgi:probable non-F420 flavinoid oxidoreductase
MLIGFHASHEQLAPSALLADVARAEAAGFAMAMCSDHFAPWSVRQGHSGFAWSWLGAALERTSLTLGVVTAPGQRYHPAITAQSIATLAEMYPGRFWAALGSGEAANEHITGQGWPSKADRDDRLLECVDIIRRLLAGDEVSHRGHVTVDRARLWSRPSVAPALLGAAVSVEKAAVVGQWADGLITINQPLDQLRQVIDAFRAGGGDKPVAVQMHLSWAPNEEAAHAIALEQWGTNALPADQLWNVETPEQFDALAEGISVDDVRRCVVVSSDLGVHREAIRAVADLGVDSLYLHHVGTDQATFIDTFGRQVLPAVGSH